jgi:perosamine synthetase
MTNPQAAIGVAQLGRIERSAPLFAAWTPSTASTCRAFRAQYFSTTCCPARERPSGSSLSWCRRSVGRRPSKPRGADIELRPFFHSLSEMPLDRPYACDCPVARGLSLLGPSLPTSNAVDLAIVEKLKRALWDALGREAAQSLIVSSRIGLRR